MVLVKRKLRAGRRAFETLASQSIGNDLLKGLVEVITNSDDSYYRLESKGIPGTGKIEIEIDRRTRSKQTLIRIRDFAEGIDNQRMDECVGEYGENVSGNTGRGFFGMGLKDTIINFGEGEIKSIKDGKLYRCRLEADDFTLYNPANADKRARRDLSIPNNGTVVEILVTNPKVRISQFESLRENLQNHVLLRLIMTDLQRTIVLRDLRSGNESTLFYQEPEIESILFSDFIYTPEFPNGKVQLTIKKAKGPFQLSQEGSCRTGGILITTRRTVHEATLFDYDSDPFAVNFFGELRCEYIYDLQHSAEPVVNRNRDGLMRNHPFTRCLFKEAKKIITSIVEKEKEKEKQRERELENENTRKRFQEAVKELNKIATLELDKIGGPGAGGLGQMPIVPRLPINNFEFIPDTYRILIGERKTLSLKLLVGKDIPVGSLITFYTEEPSLSILNPSERVAEPEDVSKPCTIKVDVEGHKPGIANFIVAKCGDKEAVALVEVVSTLGDRDKPPRAGLFKDIKYEEQDNVQRARFDKNAGTIFINTLAPSIRLYFGSGGEGQDQAQNKVLQAELVTDLACREIATQRDRKGHIDRPPGIEPMDAFYNEINRLKGEYAENIHKCLVESKYRR